MEKKKKMKKKKKKKTYTSYRDGEAGFAVTCNCLYFTA